MISIIVCHRDPAQLEQFEKSVASTVGVEYELVVIDNRENRYNIFEAYNFGIERSRFELLCFAHEDLLFHTQDWGALVAKHLADPEVGMIGVVGGNVFPECPSQWWNSSYLNDHLVNLIQHWSDDYTAHIDHPNKKPLFDGDWSVTRDLSNPTGANRIEAVALDGLWMCARKDVFQEISFDEKTFDGFHCYDSDICLQIGQKYKLFVVYDILIEHLSMGTVASHWAEAALTLARKWRSSLPRMAKRCSPEKVAIHQAKCLLTYCYWVKTKGFTDPRIRKLISEFRSKDFGVFRCREQLLLLLWEKFGAKVARYPYFFLKHFVDE